MPLIWPAAIVTVAGTVAALVLLEVRLITRPPDGAAADKVKEAIIDWPAVRAVLPDKLMLPTLVTVTLAVVSGIAGSELAWINVAPFPIPVTGTAPQL